MQNRRLLFLTLSVGRRHSTVSWFLFPGQDELFLLKETPFYISTSELPQRLGGLCSTSISRPPHRAANPHTTFRPRAARDSRGRDAGQTAWPPAVRSHRLGLGASARAPTLQEPQPPSGSQEAGPPYRGPRARPHYPRPDEHARQTRPRLRAPDAAVARAAARRLRRAEGRPSARGGARPPKSVLPVGREAAQGRGQPGKQEAAA
ncbi:hypothetical protein LEMLEM_LOCUS24218 [Lemmus lemmus]